MKRKTKNAILKSITAVAGTAFVIGALAFDSEGNIPVIMCAASLAWLVPFVYINFYMKVKGWGI